MTFYEGCSGFISSARKEWLMGGDEGWRYGKDECVRKIEKKTRNIDSLISEFGI